MSQFVYFAPSAEMLPRSFGKSASHMRGPGDQDGVFRSDDPECIRYSPEHQEWVERADGVWVGVNTDRPLPSSIDLARGEMLPGPLILLADGCVWQVPRLRVHSGQYGWLVALPARLRYEAGEWRVGEVLPEHKAADSLGERLLKRMMDAHAAIDSPDPAHNLTIAEAAGLVAEVLSLNYRVGAEELSLTGALPTDARLAEVLREAVDYDAAEAWAKKKIQQSGT